MTAHPAPVSPLLVFGWGNLSRGDDALGPMCVHALRCASNGGGQVEYLEDYQLQMEHCLDLVGRKRVLFVDASQSCRPPYQVTRLRAQQDGSFSSHALSPQGVMQVFCDLQGGQPPPCTLLEIRGERFELGQSPSGAALEHLAAALKWAGTWLAQRQ